MPRRVSRRELRKRRQREKMLANIMITVVMAIAVIWVFAYYINDYRNAITGNNTPETTGEYTEVAKKPQNAHKPDASNEDDNQESESADTDSPYELQIFGENIEDVVGKEIKKLIDEAYSKAQSILKEHRAILDAVAQVLMIQETISQEEFEEFFK